MKPLRITWESETEKLDATVDHAMLIVPEGPNDHRVYFVARTREQLARMTSVVLEMAARNDEGRPLALALHIVKTNEKGEFRGTPVPKWPK